MAPQNRPQARHTGATQNAGRSANVAPDASEDGAVEDELFLDPMLGTPLAIYIEKDVVDRDQLVEIITKNGGSVSPGYSGVPYILVDPYKESGQSLYRQYAGKKGKIVLDARWIHECVRAGELQTFHTNWAGCKVTGKEQIGAQTAPAVPTAPPTTNRSPVAPRRNRPPGSANRSHAPAPPPPPQSQPQPQPQPQAQPHQAHQPHQTHQAQASLPSFTHPQSLQAPQAQGPPSVMHPGSSLPPTNFQFPVYPGQTAQHPAGRPTLHPPTSGPPQTWQTNGLTAHVPHPQIIAPRPQNPYGRDDQWNEPSFAHLDPTDASNTLPAINGGPADGYYDQRYRDQNGWPESTPNFYEQPPYVPPYQQEQQHQQQQPEAFLPPIPGPSTQPQEPTVPSNTGPERQQRGRKRTRTQPPPAPPASTLVLNRRHPPARSPTPPTRVIKSTYGGNLFTADDVLYLKKYIDYCQEQGLVLSLREICERIAVKAPHHTFYSWRRYCNKHQIRLGGYAMDVEGNNRSSSPGEQNEPLPPIMGLGQVHGPLQTAVQGMQTIGLGPIPGSNQTSAAPKGNGPFTVNSAMRHISEQGMRNRSPTPPRALFRSTTGKGVAFTDEDVAFLCKMLAYRKLQGRLDMVTFWKDVAGKAQHHSRASWMKYYRRHKHELNRVEGDEPLPAPPAKKMRYGKNDDVLLARYFANKPEGTSDKIFQEFAKIHPHHPWKGWQEHHRIHKAKIDHLIQRIHGGETIEVGEEDD